MSRAYRDDEVFFHHNGQPKVGKVLSAGRHGCVVEHEGARHKLKWEHIAGHARRAPQEFSVEHHGDDGMIVRNQHGHRRYFSIPPEARDEQLHIDPTKQAKGPPQSNP